MKAANGRLWSRIHNDEIEIKTLTQEDVEGALMVLDKSFFTNESICIGCEINLPASAQARSELREMCRLAADDGVSVVAKHVPSDTVVGVAFNKIQTHDAPFFVQFCNDFQLSAQTQFFLYCMVDAEAESDVFDLYNIDCACEVVFLATLPGWQCKGIGRALVRDTTELVRELSQGIGLQEISPALHAKRPSVVTALFTSVFSQKIGKANGFKLLKSVPYTRYTYGSKTIDQRIDPLNKCCQHMAFLF